MTKPRETALEVSRCCDMQILRGNKSPYGAMNTVQMSKWHGPSPDVTVRIISGAIFGFTLPYRGCLASNPRARVESVLIQGEF